MAGPGAQDSRWKQYLEDERIALFLQNEEFMKELQRNRDFLLALERGGHCRGTTGFRLGAQEGLGWRPRCQVLSVLMRHGLHHVILGEARILPTGVWGTMGLRRKGCAHLGLSLPLHICSVLSPGLGTGSRYESAAFPHQAPVTGCREPQEQSDWLYGCQSRRLSE